MKRPRTGIIGCGKVGHLHASALRDLPESEFVGVCDADPARARAFAEKYGVLWFDTAGELLREIEAVMVCTPHPQHARDTIAAADAGVHVLVEKPMAASLADCDAMIEASRRAVVRLGVVSQRRFFEPVQRLKMAIAAGKIGRPVLGTLLMLSWRDEAYYRSDPWRGRWDTEGGGVLVNQVPHQLDILQWLMGPIEELAGYWGNVNHPFIEVEDTAVAALRFHGGALGSIVASVSQKPGIYTKVHIHGSNGASVGVQTDGGASFIAGMSGMLEPPLNDVWTVPGEEDRLAQFEAEDRALFARVNPVERYHRLQIEDFLRSVIEGRPPLVTGEDGRIVVEMFTAIYRSDRTRRPVRFPVPAEED